MIICLMLIGQPIATQCVELDYAPNRLVYGSFLLHTRVSLCSLERMAWHSYTSSVLSLTSQHSYCWVHSTEPIHIVFMLGVAKEAETWLLAPNSVYDLYVACGWLWILNLSGLLAVQCV